MQMEMKEMKKMINIKEDERLNKLNHSGAHLLAQAVKHLYPHAKFWVGPVIEDGFYYDIDLGDDVIKEEDSLENEDKNMCENKDKENINDNKDKIAVWDLIIFKFANELYITENIY